MLVGINTENSASEHLEGQFAKSIEPLVSGHDDH